MIKKLLFVVFILTSPQIFSQTLLLTPNESFFSPKGTLKLFGLTTVTDPYNNNKHYERIGNWKVMDDTIVWGLRNLQAGSLNIELFAGISVFENNSLVTIFLGDQQQDLSVSSTASLQDFQSQGSVSFQVPTSGNYEVKVKIKTRKTSSDFGEIEKLIVTGSALSGTEIWKRRWRPAAIHAKFLSDNDNNTEITVYEMAISTSDFWSYQVMTTEFGYLGSPVKDSLFTGLNFSLWSYGANDPVPPHRELSHLVAVGGPGNYFGRYGHEGTGVKPRGFNPYNGIKIISYTVALRKEPGSTYDTFWSYYLDPVTQHWKLYGCGKKLNKDGVNDYLKTTGGFVEVVGAPDVGRTGHRQRIVEYRGWRMQNNKNWDVIDRIDPVYNSATQLSYKEWTTNNQGNKFILKMGGLLNSGPDPGIIQLTSPSSLPFYLQGNYIDELYAMPAYFQVLNPEKTSNTEVKLRYKIENAGTNPEISLFYGTAYGLTEGIFEDKQIDPVWQHQINVPLSWINQGILEIPISGLNTTEDYYYRLRLKNDEGITWAFETDSFNLSILTARNEVISEDDLISVFPNPTKGKCHIGFTNELNVKEIALMNSAGNVVLRKNTSVSLTLNIEDFPSGIYYLVVETKENEKHIKRITKN